MKRLFSLLLLFISLNSFAQILILGKNNQLDRMIGNSIESYIENVDEFCTKRGLTPPWRLLCVQRRVNHKLYKKRFNQVNTESEICFFG